MVLRRPYAFLIKYFRLIHVIITTILILIAVKFRNISSFLSKCISNVANKYDAPDYINYGVFIWFLIALGLFFIIYWLFKYKDKPRKIYIFSIVGYIVLGIILIITYNYISGFNSNIINQKTIRLYSDILFMCNLYQYIIIIIMFIRALGFNIKKFDFARDAQELNLTNEDNEEVEVNIGIDMTNITRKLRKQGREFGYFYQEFKLYIIGILIILFIFIVFKGYQIYDKKYKLYNEGDYVGVNNFINITDSYYSINNNGDTFIIVKLNTYKKGNKDILNTSNIVLNVGDKKYLPDKNNCYKFKKYGNCYKQQYITNEEKNYILVYKIFSLNIKKTHITFNESYDKIYKIKLDIESIDD